MKRGLIAGLIVAVLLGVAAFAGPTVSLGTAYFNDGFNFGVGVGMQANNVLWNFIGAETEFVIGSVYIDPYDDPSTSDYSYLQGVGRVNLSFALPSTANGPQWYVLLGAGSPLTLQWDTDNFQVTGVEIGTVLGVEVESPAGHGAGAFLYWKNGTLAVGGEVYMDFYGLAGKKVVDVTSQVSTAPVGDLKPVNSTSGQ